ncbi:hypothetical protein R3P38DRAFT_3165182 [Favolaschia claudopus]|uniref:Uncharacterized protein n=1 Tax=Favolaschia claudopus TaxID=2862362 RepID=A0AAW0EJB1_9AGAR
MSREDRRHLSQVPEDSVHIADMPWLVSPNPPLSQEMFTLPFLPNPNDQFLSENFAYNSNASDGFFHLDGNAPLSWDPYLPTYEQVTDAVYPYFPSSIQPEFTASFPVPALPHNPDRDPHLLDLYSNHSTSYHCETLPHDPVSFSPAEQLPLTAYDHSILNFPRFFPETFTNNVSEIRHAAHPAPDAIDPSALVIPTSSLQSAVPVQVQSRTATRSRPRRKSSNPGELSSHHVKRLYVECLEHYVEYLHELFAHLNVEPLPFERVSCYRALTNRSMRTILLHLEKSADIIQAITQYEQEKMELFHQGQLLPFAHPQALINQPFHHAHTPDIAYSPSVSPEFAVEENDTDALNISSLI